MNTLEQDAVHKDDIQGREEGVQALLARAEQERTSKEAITSGLQHELERTQTKLKIAAEQVVDLKGQVLREADEKQNLYKQLELVTLRLPPPKGKFSRIFGKKKKEKDKEAKAGGQK